MIRHGRRCFLAGSAGTLVALPLLDGLRLSRAAAAPPPQRIVTVYSANGVIHEGWFPAAGSETDFELPEILTPFAPYRDRLLIFGGVDNSVTEVGPGGPHQRGIGSLYTGRELLEGEFVDGCGSRAGWVNGISVDQAIANVIGVDTPLKSLELGVRAQEADVQARISYAGPGQPLPPLNDPRAVYERLFANMVSTPIDPDDPDDQRAAVLDTVKDQFSILSGKLGAADRAKLEQHVELVRDIERRLAGRRDPEGVCEEPAAPPVLDPNSENDMPLVMQSHLDLLAAAFACDLTRVASLQISTGFNRIRFPWLDSLGEGHGLSHAGPSQEDAKQQLIRRRKWEAEQLVYLMDRLAQIPEGEGTVLDSTMILWGSDVSLGNTHTLTNMPYLIAGNAGGKLRGGRYLQYQGRSNNDLLIAVLNAFGIETNTFGHPDYATGPLSGVLA